MKIIVNQEQMEEEYEVGDWVQLKYDVMTTTGQNLPPVVKVALVDNVNQTIAYWVDKEMMQRGVYQMNAIVKVKPPNESIAFSNLT